MRYTKRVSWPHRSLACVMQTNIRTEYTNVRRDTQNTHTHTRTPTRTRTTRLKRPQFGVSVHILKLLSSDLRHLESKRMPRVNNTHTHTVHDTFCYRKISLPEERYLLHLRQKNKKRMSFAHTHTVNDISATAGNTLDCLTISSH